MNIRIIMITALAMLAFQAQPFLATAQEQYNEINYKIPNAYYQAAGRSSQLNATVEYDDTTHVIEDLEWEVPLFSFVNQYGGAYNYIAAFGNASNFPWMRFESTSVKDQGETVELRGTLYFRGDYRPLTIVVNRKEKDGLLYLYGDFTLPLRDYFLLATPRLRVPPYIDMNLNVVFDLSAPDEG